MPAPTNDVILPLIRAAGPVIRQRFRPDCCLNGTRVMIEVFRGFGIPARAAVVRVMAINAAWKEQALRLGRAPVAAELEGDAWAIGIGDPGPVETGGGWPGHVVCVVRDTLVDTAAGNISRPLRNILVPDFVVTPLHRTWDRGDLGVEVQLPRNGTLLYHAVPGNRSHEGLPGFQRSKHNLDAAREIRARVAITA